MNKFNLYRSIDMMYDVFKFSKRNNTIIKTRGGVKTKSIKSSSVLHMPISMYKILFGGG